MLDHSQNDLREACGISKERWIELKKMALEITVKHNKWSEVIEEVIKMGDMMSCLELVLLAMNVKELMMMDEAFKFLKNIVK